jgi:phosphoserine phosphatase RsbU/P
MRRTGDGPGRETRPAAPAGGGQAELSALLGAGAEELYDNAPCGDLTTLPDGRIVKVNRTLLDWLGYRREELVGRRRFFDLLTGGCKLYHETHYAPLLRMQGEIGGIALELRRADGSRLPVLVTSMLRTGTGGEPLLIRTTVFDARDRRAYEVELLRARQEADRERERLQRLNAALQATLLPPTLAGVPGLEVAAHYHIASADEVGGDFYDLYRLGDGAWGFFLGDVCGKGTAAAAVASLARHTLRAAARHDPDPVAVLGDLNTVLNDEYQDLEPQFCTVILGLLVPDGDRGGFRVTLAGGGHPPALLLRADGGADWLPTPGGQLVGVLPRAHVATTAVHLGPGDTLLLYTDGLTEARTGDRGGRYGNAALLDFARSLAPTTAHAAVAALNELLDAFGTGLDDDTAVLAVSVPPPPPAAGPSAPA